MARLRPQHIVINFDSAVPDVDRVRAFNVALYYLAQKTQGVSVSRDQIEKLTGQRVTVKSARKLQQEIAKIEQLIAKHGFADLAEVVVVYPHD